MTSRTIRTFELGLASLVLALVPLACGSPATHPDDGPGTGGSVIGGTDGGSSTGSGGGNSTIGGTDLGSSTGAEIRASDRAVAAAATGAGAAVSASDHAAA